MFRLHRFFAVIVLLFAVLSSIAFIPVRAIAVPMLIIDPGHGGEDGGAVAADGTIEAQINWEISDRCVALAEFLGLPVCMTRKQYAVDYPPEAESVRSRKTADQKSRAALVNSVDNAILISIHQNKFTNSAATGPQVFYNDNPVSAALAAWIQDGLTEQLCPQNRRVAAPVAKDVWLMQQVNCPAVLIECGFLSNPDETKLLCSSTYQKALSLVVLGSFLQELSPDKDNAEIHAAEAPQQEQGGYNG